ncbi:hypothetical protein FISHEDRAFT_42869 [Fistulina hepatica ATCC 64428]|uniref:DDE Tnp4 domain-containing protein n=1 Tax=Fistulina hepatica ATCC 64428 TaxID=1128425 RepID=A0A0D7AFL0_9AGAR|nr:hypothetical protein FISHEDRAFT_42869 [Fistulina hepatica ATCC 64428]
MIGDLELDFQLLLLLWDDEDDEIEDETQLENDALSAILLAYSTAETYQSVKSEQRAATRTYLKRLELLPHPWKTSPWQSLFVSCNDRAFITTMGLDVETFNLILNGGFSEKWNTTRVTRPDRPGTAHPRLSRRSLDAAGALGLILHYLNSTISDINLCQIFALIPSTVNRYIDFSLALLLETLRQLPGAHIRWLTGHEFEHCNNIVIRRHPLLTGAFGTMDGLNVPVQASADEDIENATYNGWLHSHFVSLVIAFASTGEIIGCRLNAPGSWHDARIARPIYEKLEMATPDGFYLVTDTAFPQGTDRIRGKIRAPMKENTRLPLDAAERQLALNFDRQLLSFRQTAEWGMRAIQGSFGRLRVPLPIKDSSRRGNILEVCLRLHQLRTRKVGINQIYTVYVTMWTEDAEQDRIYHQFKNIFFSEQRKVDRVARFHLIESWE